MANSTPKFQKPPVVETVLGVQFAELAGFLSSHFGLYYDRIRQQYPECKEQPRLRPVNEEFPRRMHFADPSIELAPVNLPNRMWFISKSGSELIQLQSDRFLFNWRERAQSGYGSYDENSETFLNELGGFCEFCDEIGLEHPKPNLCEVTYINHIDPLPNESIVDLFAKVFTGLELNQKGSWLPEPEAFSYNRVYEIDKVAGRLYAEATIATRFEEETKKQFIVLKMTGRVRLLDEKSGSIADSLRKAHDWVVNGFADITDTQIQDERWMRQS